MKFRLSNALADYTIYYIPPHSPEEASVGSRHPNWIHFPQEGFKIEWSSESQVYDTDRDARLNDKDHSKWIQNEFKHPDAGPDIKERVETFLLNHDAVKNKGYIRLFDPEKEPITLTGDDLTEYRRFKESQARKKAVGAGSEK